MCASALRAPVGVQSGLRACPARPLRSGLLRRLDVNGADELFDAFAPTFGALLMASIMFCKSFLERKLLSAPLAFELVSRHRILPYRIDILD